MFITILMISSLGAYLLGSISSAILVCRLWRLPDPRTQGSGNPGATNVLRVGGKIPAVFTLLGDVIKGYLPVVLTKIVCLKMGIEPPFILSAVLLGAVLGHLYPVFFHFKGGKGVATALGGILGISLSLGGIFILIWLGVFVLTRYSSLAALIAMVSMPFWAYVMMDNRYIVGFSILAILILWRHKENISRLLSGKESKSSFTKVS